MAGLVSGSLALPRMKAIADRRGSGRSGARKAGGLTGMRLSFGIPAGTGASAERGISTGLDSRRGSVSRRGSGGRAGMGAGAGPATCAGLKAWTGSDTGARLKAWAILGAGSGSRAGVAAFTAMGDSATLGPRTGSDRPNRAQSSSRARRMPRPSPARSPIAISVRAGGGKLRMIGFVAGETTRALPMSR